MWPWLLVLVLAGVTAPLAIHAMLEDRGAEPIVWQTRGALVLLAGALLVGVVAFHLQRRRAAVLGFSHVGMVTARGVGAWLADLPAVLRVVGLAALVIGLARPATYRTIKRDIDTIDIMIVVDMSRSMEQEDMPHDRLDAAQRVIRKFLHRSGNDRIGLVVFGQQAMLQCPLTQDQKVLEQIVADLQIGDVPELGTAIGDGLALALAQLRRSTARSKVVILLSDGDSNWVTQFSPEDAARVARQMGVKVYTLLVGREDVGLFGDATVNPATLRSIAEITGGEFFLAEDYDAFERGFTAVRHKLDKTKRTVTQRVPDKQLFVVFAAIGAAFVAAGLVLGHTRLRRLP
jgi:Ca-activated chloride channel family protein